MDYITEIKALVERSVAFAGKNVHITVIANPVAGGFTIRKRAEENKAAFHAALAAVADRPVLTATCSIVMHLTASAGHANRLARSVLETARADATPGSLYLLVAAGGDGTSLDIQTELAQMYFAEKAVELADRVCLIRMPFGTGNDGSDGRTLAETLSLLTEDSAFYRQGAIRVHSAGKEKTPWYAFNIASVGLDAFVTNMTNRIKSKLPGNFYKIWVDLACVFYNRIYHVGEMSVHATLHDGTVVRDHVDRMILYVIGVSGHRTYGANKKILPDEHNVCGVAEMPLLRKLSLKQKFMTGQHSGYKETSLYTADRLVIQYAEKILVQMDGEAHLLSPSDFPLVMERTEPFITILRTTK